MLLAARIWALSFGIALAGLTSVATAAPPTLPIHAEGHWIVGFHRMPDVGPGDGLYGATVRRIVAPLRAAVVSAPGLSVATARADPNVRYVEFDDRGVAPPFAPNDPDWSQAWGWGPRAMNAGLAWDATRGNNSLVVGVIDTGVNGHEDIDSTRLVAGYDFWNHDTVPEDPPECNHGTGVTSVLAATINNGKGLAGMAQVKVMPLRIYGGAGSCGGSYGALGEALVHGVDAGVRVFSIQFQGRASMQFVNDSVSYAHSKGAILVVSAGNWGACEPSCVAQTWRDNADKVVVVGAMDEGRNRAWFSSVGPEVDVTAPGTNLVAASNACGSCYSGRSGTSFSTPHAAGVVALMKSAVPGATRDEIVQRLLSTAIDIGAPGKDNEHGHGLIDAGTAVARWPAAFDAKFRNVAGNEYWVQAHVDANHPLVAVHARKGTDSWQPLAQQPWGGWAASLALPSGSTLQLRATDDAGATDVSSCFLWPEARLAPCPGGPTSGATSFQHKGGNEWWVEAIVAPEPISVQAMDSGGPWTPLTKQTWGAWAASFHIEPGHLVRFRASLADGSVVESCAFTHPQGVAQCGSASSSFKHKGGNEWWVEAAVTPDASSVYARDDSGPWTALTLRTWGNWAGSFHIEPGHRVQFRAIHPDGLQAHSCWFEHPSGAPAGCGTDPLPPFEATFSDVKGNEWWIESKVSVVGGSLQRVDARVNAGAWTPLDLKTWGNWAKSIHAPAVSVVEFRAVAADGREDLSDRYTWPPP